MSCRIDYNKKKFDNVDKLYDYYKKGNKIIILVSFGMVRFSNSTCKLMAKGETLKNIEFHIYRTSYLNGEEIHSIITKKDKKFSEFDIVIKNGDIEINILNSVFARIEVDNVREKLYNHNKELKYDIYDKLRIIDLYMKNNIGTTINVYCDYNKSYSSLSNIYGKIFLTENYEKDILQLAVLINPDYQSTNLEDIFFLINKIPLEIIQELEIDIKTEGIDD